MYVCVHKMGFVIRNSNGETKINIDAADAEIAYSDDSNADVRAYSTRKHDSLRR